MGDAKFNRFHKCGLNPIPHPVDSSPRQEPSRRFSPVYGCFHGHDSRELLGQHAAIDLVQLLTAQKRFDVGNFVRR